MKSFTVVLSDAARDFSYAEPVTEYHVLAPDEDSAIDIAFIRLGADLGERPAPTWYCVTCQPRVGGYRPGAGRKPSGEGPKPPSTKSVRLPNEIADLAKQGKLEDLLELIADWKDRSETASDTSPRWQQMRLFLSEFDRLEIPLN